LPQEDAPSDPLRLAIGRACSRCRTIRIAFHRNRVTRISVPGAPAIRCLLPRNRHRESGIP